MAVRVEATHIVTHTKLQHHRRVSRMPLWPLALRSPPGRLNRERRAGRGEECSAADVGAVWAYPIGGSSRVCRLPAIIPSVHKQLAQALPRSTAAFPRHEAPCLR